MIRCHRRPSQVSSMVEAADDWRFVCQGETREEVEEEEDVEEEEG